MLQFPIMTAQEIALDAAFAFAAPHTVLECCFNLFHIRSCTLLGTIHLRRQHVLGGRGVPMCRWSKGHST